MNNDFRAFLALDDKARSGPLTQVERHFWNESAWTAVPLLRARIAELEALERAASQAAELNRSLLRTSKLLNGDVIEQWRLTQVERDELRTALAAAEKERDELRAQLNRMRNSIV